MTTPRPKRARPHPAVPPLAARLAALIRQRGLRRSRQRDLVAGVFFGMGGHVTVEELTRRVRARDPSVGVATVYRTVKLLSELGLAVPRQFGDDGQTRYERASPARHHDHIICTGCGEIVEFENERIEALQQVVARRHGFSLGGHRLELYGECAACRRPAQAVAP